VSARKNERQPGKGGNLHVSLATTRPQAQRNHGRCRRHPLLHHHHRRRHHRHHHDRCYCLGGRLQGGWRTVDRPTRRCPARPSRYLIKRSARVEESVIGEDTTLVERQQPLSCLSLMVHGRPEKLNSHTVMSMRECALAHVSMVRRDVWHCWHRRSFSCKRALSISLFSRADGGASSAGCMAGACVSVAQPFNTPTLTPRRAINDGSSPQLRPPSTRGRWT
jgi:hypothetical protein